MVLCDRTQRFTAGGGGGGEASRSEKLNRKAPEELPLGEVGTCRTRDGKGRKEDLGRQSPHVRLHNLKSKKWIELRNPRIETRTNNTGEGRGSIKDRPDLLQKCKRKERRSSLTGSND